MTPLRSVGSSVQRSSRISALGSVTVGCLKATTLPAPSSTSSVNAPVVFLFGSGSQACGWSLPSLRRRMSQKYKRLASTSPLLTATSHEVTEASVASSRVHAK
ncbi:hypothetical protein [Stigmatella aurantiaca]|uniref:hypothetical protein n=1 Tax=Stigmatella aurantiaca TaxID=41 RepID=UPI002FC2A5EC